MQVTLPGISTDEPSVAVLLDVDAEYRRKAAARVLPRITPRPRTRVLHTQRGEWHCTARYSNSELAHRLRRTRDWVVITFHRWHEPPGLRTVVTETRGPLEGRRVVRGRECEVVARRDLAQPA